MFLSVADPTISEAGGDPARDISADVPCSETVGVEGWLREIDDNDGCRENCFSRAAERMVERSVAAEVGAISVFWVVVVVVSRRVLGRLAEVQSGDFVETSVGVLGGDPIVVGVATTFCGRTCGSVFEGDNLGLGVGGTASGISTLSSRGRTFAYEKGRSPDWEAVPDLDPLSLAAESFIGSMTRECGCLDDSRLTLGVFEAVFVAAMTTSSAVLMLLAELGTVTSLLSFSGLEVSGISFTFGLGLLGR